MKKRITREWQSRKIIQPKMLRNVINLEVMVWIPSFIKKQSLDTVCKRQLSPLTWDVAFTFSSDALASGNNKIKYLSIYINGS